MKTVSKADKLALRLREVLGDERAKINRPIKKADLRIAGLNESVTSSELVTAMATFGGCAIEDCKVGEIRRGPTGLGTVWASCPATAAKKMVDARRIRVGWVMARIEALSPRPFQCFRCLEPGHTRARCSAPFDRGDKCYRCGQPGHTARGCAESPKCPLCSDIGRPSGHRLGSVACAPSQKRKGALKNYPGSKEAGKSVDNRSDGATSAEVETSRMDVETMSSPKPKRLPRLREASPGKGWEGDAPDSAPLPPSPPSGNKEHAPEEAMDMTL